VTEVLAKEDMENDIFLQKTRTNRKMREGRPERTDGIENT